MAFFIVAAVKTSNPEYNYYFGYCPLSTVFIQIHSIEPGSLSVIRCKEGKFLHQEEIVPATGEWKPTQLSRHCVLIKML
jgi:hypothetical protein